jgi:hypothetical protein
MRLVNDDLREYPNGEIADICRRFNCVATTGGAPWRDWIFNIPKGEKTGVYKNRSGVWLTGYASGRTGTITAYGITADVHYLDNCQLEPVPWKPTYVSPRTVWTV